MASIPKIILSIITTGIFFMSCKNQINPAIIKAYADKNKIMEQKVSEMKEFKERILSEREISHSEMMSAIDPKKRTAYNKDRTMKFNMGNLKDKMDETIQGFEENYNALTTMVKDNRAFIAVLPRSSESEATIKSQWKKRVMEWEQIEDDNMDLQNKITTLMNQYNELQKEVIKKYGRLKQQKVTV